MRYCRHALFAAITGMSLATAAWAQPAVPNDQPMTDPAAPATPATPGNDAMGNQPADQTHEMQSGAMGADADAQLKAQLMKIEQSPENAGDQLFALDNAKGNMWEVEFSRLVESKAQDAKVKELAAMIVKDHSAANVKLEPIARKLGLDLPKSLPSEKQTMLSIMSKLPVADLESAYLMDMRANHAKDITCFADHQKSVKDEDLRGYISMVLPKLKEHGGHVNMVAGTKGMTDPMGDMKPMGGMRDGGHNAVGNSAGGSGANADPTAPVNNQNPSNR